MTELSAEDIQQLKIERIAELIEQALLDTALAVLSRLSERQQQLPLPICFKTDCPMRDVIPF